MPARLRALDDQRVGAVAHEFAGEDQGGGEADEFGTQVADAPHAARVGTPPASTTCPTPVSPQTSMRASNAGCMVMRLTPNGRSVSARVAAISSCRRSGSIAPQADHAEAAGLRDGGDEPAFRHPGHGAAEYGPFAAENSAPRVQSRFRRSVASIVPVESIGRVQCACRKFRVLLRDQHADLDFRGGYHLYVNAALGKVANILCATPAWLRMPAPTTETLATSGSLIRDA